MRVRTSPSGWLMQALIVPLAFTAVVYGQNQTPQVPNISGTWELVNFDGNRDIKTPEFPKMKLVIEQDAKQLKVTEKRIRQGKEEARTFVYDTDGKGDTNPSRVELWRTELSKFESVTRVDKNRIVTEFKPELTMMTGIGRTPTDAPYLASDRSSHRTDEWSLDDSGKTLTLKTHVTNIQTLRPIDNSSDDFINFKLKFRRL